MKVKVYFIALLSVVFLLTACPAPEYSHVIINGSSSILEIEYEYAVSSLKYDSSQISAPAKMNFDQYENTAGQKSWSDLTEQNKYKLEFKEKSYDSSAAEQPVEQKIATVKITLLPNEILRVFVSAHINSDIRSLRRIRLQSEGGKMEIEGAGFEQFTAYQSDRFFAGTRDYRIVYH